MQSDRRPALLVSVAMNFALLLGLYAEAYYAVVEESRGDAMYPAGGGHQENCGILSKVFAPIHWLDRKLRPEVWGPEKPKTYRRRGPLI